MDTRDAIAVPATPAGMRVAVDAFEAFSRNRHLPPRLRKDVLIALDEILSNVVRHGRSPESAPIHLTFTVSQHHLEVQISDSGVPFNPLLAPAPDVEAPLEARRPGGLGIAIVRALMDEVEYDRRDNRNVLTLRSRWQRGPEAPGEADR